jgi:hypothetical protein
MRYGNNKVEQQVLKSGDLNKSDGSFIFLRKLHLCLWDALKFYPYSYYVTRKRLSRHSQRGERKNTIVPFFQIPYIITPRLSPVK